MLIKETFQVMLVMYFCVKGTIKAPKMQRNCFASVFKLTENYGVLNYNTLYRVRLAMVVNNSDFVRPET